MAEPTRLGRYQLTKVLGRGAMGVVYEGLDPRLNRRVAIKTILKNAAIDEETSQMYSAQFAREAQAAGRLNHPNIVHVHDFAEEGEIAYLVMEYIQGRELRSYFDAKEKFELPEAVRIMGELLDALHFAHEAGIIHRDVKPANVMLDAEKRVKLADFGVARIQDSERSAAGTMVGTPAFMSPEQISGGKIDRRTDVFSAGVVLYQLLTGDQPFTGAGAWTVAKKIMQDDPPQPSSVVKSVSPAFDAIVHKALAKKAGERYASAREFATDLRAALGGSQPSATASLPPAAPARAKPAPQASEAEVEFWKAIQNSTDAAEFEFYLEQFPEGTYAALARHKIARLNAQAAPAAQDTVRLAAEAAERQHREAEEQAQREAADKARREAEERAKREAEEARRAAQEKAEAEARARAEAEARARAEAEARAKKIAEELAQRQAAERAKREAEEQAKRAAEERARQAAALAKLRQQEEARKAAAPDPDATVAMARPARAAAPAEPVEEKKKSFLVPALIGAALVIAGAGAFFALNRKPAPVAEAPTPVQPAAPVAAPAAPAAPVVDEAKIRREVEERIRREYAEKSAAEQAAAAKAATEKAIQEKQLAAKATAEKAAADKAAAEKTAAEKLASAKSASERAALEKAAADKAAAEKAAAEKATADKLAAEKAAAEKAATEKAAAEKAATAKAAAARKPGWPAIGDRWVYEVTDSQRPENRYTFSVEATAVGPGGITDVTTRRSGATQEGHHGANPVLVNPAPGIVIFAPYMLALQSGREGQSWKNLEYRGLFRCNSGFECTANASVEGRERVTVKAGSYDTTKVLVTVYGRNPGGGMSVIELRFWYASAAARYVKYQLRTTATGFSQPLMDLELVSYTPAGG